MTEEFKIWCRDAFRFLLTEYEFQELPSPRHTPYEVGFGNGLFKIVVLGEGHGTIANIEYITNDGIKVGIEILESGWEPFKKGNWKKKQHLTQKEQIGIAANRIKERDIDILGGDLTRLNEAAARLQWIRNKMGHK